MNVKAVPLLPARPVRLNNSSNTCHKRMSTAKFLTKPLCVCTVHLGILLFKMIRAMPVWFGRGGGGGGGLLEYKFNNSTKVPLAAVVY